MGDKMTGSRKKSLANKALEIFTWNTHNMEKKKMLSSTLYLYHESDILIVSFKTNVKSGIHDPSDN